MKWWKYTLYLFQTDKSYLSFNNILHTQGNAAHTCVAAIIYLNKSTFRSYCFPHIGTGKWPQTTDRALQKCNLKKCRKDSQHSWNNTLSYILMIRQCRYRSGRTCSQSTVHCSSLVLWLFRQKASGSFLPFLLLCPLQHFSFPPTLLEWRLLFPSSLPVNLPPLAIYKSCSHCFLSKCQEDWINGQLSLQ